MVISTSTQAPILETQTKSTRLQSLDALRGFDMFWIMGGEYIFITLSKATDVPFFHWMAEELEHTPWHGFTFYDMIFPLFLFIAGVSMPYSLSTRLISTGNRPAESKASIYLSMLKRTLILILLGAVVNGLLDFNGLENTRFPSVLGRIGLAWFFAGIIFLNNHLRGQILWFFGILLGYWAAMMLIPVPGFGAADLSMEGSLAGYIDRLLVPGKLYLKVHDPEGLFSIIPAIGTALLGAFTGQFLRLNSPSMAYGTQGNSHVLGRFGFTGNWPGLASGIPDEQKPVDQLLCHIRRWLEPDFFIDFLPHY